LKRGICFDDDTIELGCVGKPVFLDGDLFRIRAGLDADDIAGLRGINGVLNRGVTRSLSATGRIRAIDVEDAFVVVPLRAVERTQRNDTKPRSFLTAASRCTNSKKTNQNRLRNPKMAAEYIDEYLRCQ
jgi:hypothetical protein